MFVDWAEWVCATPHTRRRIVNDVIYEMETYGDCYHIQQYSMMDVIDSD